MSKFIGTCERDTPNIVIAHTYHSISILLLNLFELSGCKRISLINNFSQLYKKNNNDNMTILIVDDDFVNEAFNLWAYNRKSFYIVWITKKFGREDEKLICPPYIDEVVKMPFDIWDVLDRIQKILPKGENDEKTANDYE